MKYFLLALGFGALFAAAQDTVTVTQKATGRSLEVVPSKIVDSTIWFTHKGKDFSVPLDSLTADSVESARMSLENAAKTGVKSTASGASSSFAKVNEAIGHKLFGTTDLWSETAAEIAKRLKWPTESRKLTSSSYRQYPAASYTFLGARPYCVTLYGGSEDAPQRLSLVFANKGDYGSTAGMGEDHFRQVNPGVKPPTDLDSAIKVDEQIIERSLTGALGEPESQYYGEKEDKRRVKRWDAGDHSFLLSAKNGEYVHLLVVTNENADKQGKIKFVKDEVLKASHQKNIVEKDNGDVWIDNIPMVNQGPKGYCAPATFERAMRYMNVPADMYLLATAATAPGGGTNTNKLADDAKRIVRSKARRIKDISFGGSGLKPRDVKSYIDKGVPILWQMRSLSKYNDIANKRSKERSAVQDWEQWAEDLQEEADDVVGSLKAESQHHICMIIGYNEETNEVAVSDSWGPRYELRWIHADIADAVTSSYNEGFVIDF